mmetsp:Transcript_34731/g.77230  ORF Transcript_34731/g.77230 Transcript_34731/m.77230 type:complete len:254 (+) Transcript_34731:1640-2401(+)
MLLAVSSPEMSFSLPRAFLLGRNLTTNLRLPVMGGTSRSFRELTALVASSGLRKLTNAYMRPGKVTTSSTTPKCSNTALRTERGTRVLRLPSHRCFEGPRVSSFTSLLAMPVTRGERRELPAPAPPPPACDRPPAAASAAIKASASVIAAAATADRSLPSSPRIPAPSLAAAARPADTQAGSGPLVLPLAAEPSSCEMRSWCAMMTQPSLPCSIPPPELPPDLTSLNHAFSAESPESRLLLLAGLLLSAGVSA